MSRPQTRAQTLSQCEAAWRAGIPLKVTADGFPIVMKPSMQCEVTVKGTQEIAYVGFPKDVEKDELLEKIRAFLKEIPRLTAEQFEAADDGIYTWILASVGGSEPTFYASRTTAMLELGTVHYSIATAIGATTVHGAGEVWKHGDEFTFNFLSGTFMDKWPLPPECPLKTMQTYLQQRLKAIFAYLFRSKALKFRETEPTFINTRLLELTKEELQGYVKAGFVVCLHDKANKAECKSTRSACEKPMTLEQEMKGGNGELMVQGQRVALTPRTARTQRRIVEREPGMPSQFELAKKRLSFSELSRPSPTEIGKAPEPAGWGGRKRKTRKHRKVRRHRTYRGGVTPEEVAEAALREPPPQGPLQQAMQRMKSKRPKTPAHALGPSDTMWSASAPASWTRSPAPAAETPLWARLSADAPAWAPPPPMPPDDQMPPEFLMFFDVADSLDLTPAQQQYMVDVFYTAREKGVDIRKDSLMKHMRHTKLTNTKL